MTHSQFIIHSTMVMERLEAARKLSDNQDQVRQKAIKTARNILKDFEVVDPGPKVDGQIKPIKSAERPDRPKVYPEISLSYEHKRQAANLAGLFAKELGISKKEYQSSLPKFSQRPESYKGRLDLPLLVEARIPWLRQVELADIAIYDYLMERAEEVSDWQDDPKGFTTPDTSYVTWSQNGTRFVNIKPKDIRQQISEDERGGTIYDGIAYAIHYPKVVAANYFDLIGSQVGADRLPYLYRWDGCFRLRVRWDDDAGPGVRSLVCGREIGT